MLPNTQQGASCGYIAAQAAVSLHSASHWFDANILAEITDENLVPQYNAILGAPTGEATFLTDRQILTIMQQTAGTRQGLPWLQGLVPINYFMKTLERRVARKHAYRNNLYITIVNTTSLTGPITEQPVGDHWICVAYQIR